MVRILCLGYIFAVCPSFAFATVGPNLVLIHTDDLGINDLGCYGRKDHRTPNIDKLAMQGIRFTSAYCAQSICSPSRAALLTGKSPARLHLTTYLPGRPDSLAQKVLHPPIRTHLPLNELTLATHLRRGGYATACIGKWHLGGAAFSPKKFGFDVYRPGLANTKPSISEGGKGEFGLTADAIAFVRKNANRPFFLYLNHNSPHIPLAARPDLIRGNKDSFNPLYAAVIETLDQSVGKLLTALADAALDKHTIVYFTSDNGALHVPELRDDAPTHNTPFRAGKGFLYEGGLRVPLIVRWPGKVKAGVVTDVPVVITDLLPTLLELVGLPVPKGIDGVSYASVLLGTGNLTARSLFWHFPHYTNQGGRPGGAVRDGRWKLVAYYDGGKPELYDLTADPSEANDLSAKHPSRVKAMLAALVAWRKSVGAQENRPNPDFDSRLYRKLYIETDVSKLRPAKTAAEMTPALREWRKTMDAVTRRPK